MNYLQVMIAVYDMLTFFYLLMGFSLEIAIS